MRQYKMNITTSKLKKVKQEVMFYRLLIFCLQCSTLSNHQWRFTITPHKTWSLQSVCLEPSSTLAVMHTYDTIVVFSSCVALGVKHVSVHIITCAWNYLSLSKNQNVGKGRLTRAWRTHEYREKVEDLSTFLQHKHLAGFTLACQCKN